MEGGEIDVDYVARLARIELTDEERAVFSKQLGDILEHMKKLQTVDTSGVEPTAHAFPIVNVLREDTVEPGLSTQEALSNAPQAHENQFVVPRVVDES